MEKIAFLIPATTNKRPWKTPQETDLWRVLCKSLVRNNLKYKITVYVGFDGDDKVYGKRQCKALFSAQFPQFKLKWVAFNRTYKGKVTHIWNDLGKQAIADGFEYLNVMGSDIDLPKQADWLDVFLKRLKQNENKGWVAGLSPPGNTRIPTQFFIHRKHIDTFGFIFPPELHNWYCDDWLAEIYWYLEAHGKYRVWLKQYIFRNTGGSARYKIQRNDKTKQPKLIKKYSPMIEKLK